VVAVGFFLLVVAAHPTDILAQQWNGPDASGNISNTNTGNVGIGTSNPDLYARLNVYKAAGAGVDVQSSSAGGWSRLRLVTGTHTYGWFTGDSTQPDAPNKIGLYDYTASAFRMMFDSSGNVGIGTPTPGAKLEVDGSGLLRVTEGTRTAPTSGVGLELSADSSGSYVGAYNRSTSSYRRLYFYGSPYVFEGGNVGIGITNPQKKLDVQGDIQASGTIFAKYQDVAEWVPSSEQLGAGTVVVLDQTKSNQVTSSTTAYDTRVAGVISAQPGITLGEKSDSKVLVATTGRVRVRVDASRGSIAIGDLLVTSDVPGLAMKSEAVNLGGVQIHRPGTIIGKALEPLAKGKGEILVLLSLQ